VLEPVGTIPEFRRKGLAFWLIDEGERRVSKLGARKLYVGSDQDFYRAIGFKVVIRQNLWEYRAHD
jgi:predicted N-acetyltransferase YhbS